MASRTIHNPAARDVVTFLELASETGGARTVIENRCSPGGGVPLHYHHAFDEELIAVDGPLTVTLGHRTMVLQPGERVMVPRGTPHSYRNATAGDVTFHANLAPGAPGFENFLRVMAGLARDGETKPAGMPKDFKTLAMLLRWADTNMSGPLRLMNPLMAWVAARAEAEGAGARLREKYDCEV